MTLLPAVVYSNKRRLSGPIMVSDSAFVLMISVSSPTQDPTNIRLLNSTSETAQDFEATILLVPYAASISGHFRPKQNNDKIQR